MAWGNFVLDKGFLATAPLTRFRLVKAGAATEQVSPIVVITDDVFGVAQFGITAAELLDGKDASIRVIGVSEVEASGAILYGRWCTLDADGRVSQLVAASGKKIVGKCMGNPAVNAGDRIAMLIVHTNAVA
jgi:Uncharacterized conserved protein (DUF2190)